jgi:PKHD-type hydroxylase
MIVQLQNVLNPDQIRAALSDLASADDPEPAAEARNRHGAAIGAALQADQPFLNTILPTALTQFGFHRHAPGTAVGDQMANPIAALGGSSPVRIDLVCVVFLADPASYDGGELIVESATLPMPIKLPAGCAIVFPATDFYSSHPVTRGENWVASCGIQSAVRGTRQREILTEMWLTLNDFQAMQPAQQLAENEGFKILGKARSNLIRLLAET